MGDYDEELKLFWTIPDLMLKPSDMDTARGLYAGMILLNELEPLEEANSRETANGNETCNVSEEAQKWALLQPKSDMAREKLPGSHERQQKDSYSLGKKSQFNWPSILAYLLHLSVSIDGRFFFCDSADCDRDMMSVSLAAVEAHFFQCHCEHLPSEAFMSLSSGRLEIDENFRNARHDWLLGSLFQKAEERFNRWMTMTDVQRANLKILDEKPKKRRPSILDLLRRKRQWSVLQDLRSDFASRIRRCSEILCNNSLLDFGVSLKFRSTPAEMLDTGILTIKDILTGGHPKTLEEVYAFVNLSYSMQDAMRHRGLSPSFCPRGHDFWMWRESMTSTYDRILFDEMVPRLWPEIAMDYKNYLWPNPFSSPEGILEMLPPSTENHPALHSFFGNSVTQMLRDFEDDEIFNFSTFLNIPDPVDDETAAPEVQRMIPGVGSKIDVPQECSTSAWESDRQSGKDEPPPPMCGESVLKIAPGETQNGIHSSLPDLLRQTALFLAVLAFLTYIAQLGSLLTSLAGTGAYPRSLRTESSVAISNFVCFVESSKRHVLNPLLIDPELLDVAPLFVVTGKMLETGWFSSIRDLENYILQSMAPLSPSQSSFAIIVRKTLSGCLAAVSQVSFEFIYGGITQDIIEYNQEYVDFRQRLEMRKFSLQHECQHKANAAAEETLSKAADILPTGPSFDAENQVLPDFEIPDFDFATAFDTEQSRFLAEQHTESASPALANSAETTHNAQSSAKSTPTDIHAIQTDEVEKWQSSVSNTILRQTCDIPGCNKIFNGGDSSSNLRRHKREKHANISWTCPFRGCGIISTRLHNLRQHWLRKHSESAMPTQLMATRSRGGGGLSRHVNISRTLVR